MATSETQPKLATIENSDFVDHWVGLTMKEHITRGDKLRKIKSLNRTAGDKYSKLISASNTAKPYCPEFEPSKKIRPRSPTRPRKMMRIQSSRSPRKYCPVKSPSTKIRQFQKCPLRIIELATPSKRHCLDTYKSKARKYLPDFMLERLKHHIMEQDPLIKVHDAIDCFKRRHKPSETKRYKPTRKNAKEKKKISELRKLCLRFGARVAKRLFEPMHLTLIPEVQQLSDVVDCEINKLYRSRSFPIIFYESINNRKIQTEISDKVAVWITTIIKEASLRMLVEDVQDLEDEEGPALDVLDLIVNNVADSCALEPALNSDDSSSISTAIDTTTVFLNKELDVDMNKLSTEEQETTAFSLGIVNDETINDDKNDITILIKKDDTQEQETFELKADEPDEPSVDKEDIEPLMNEVEPLIDEVKPQIHEAKPQIDEVKPLIVEVEPVMDENEPLMEENDPLIVVVEPLITEVKLLINEVEPLIDEVEPLTDEVEPLKDEVEPNQDIANELIEDNMIEPEATEDEVNKPLNNNTDENVSDVLLDVDDRKTLAFVSNDDDARINSIDSVDNDSRINYELFLERINNPPKPTFYPKPDVDLSVPNDHLLCAADETWPEEPTTLMRGIGSVVKSVTSLGMIAERLAAVNTHHESILTEEDITNLERYQINNFDLNLMLNNEMETKDSMLDGNQKDFTISTEPTPLSPKLSISIEKNIAVAEYVQAVVEKSDVSVEANICNDQAQAKILLQDTKKVISTSDKPQDEKKTRKGNQKDFKQKNNTSNESQNKLTTYASKAKSDYKVYPQSAPAWTLRNYPNHRSFDIHKTTINTNKKYMTTRTNDKMYAAVDYDGNIESRRVIGEWSRLKTKLDEAAKEWEVLKQRTVQGLKLQHIRSANITSNAKIISSECYPKCDCMKFVKDQSKSRIVTLTTVKLPKISICGGYR